MVQRALRTPAIIVIALALVVAACGGGGEAPGGGGGGQAAGGGPQDLGQATIVLGGRVITWAPAYVAVCEGTFADEGLDVELTVSEQGTASAIAALVAGDVLSAMTGGSAAINPVREGAPVQLLFNASVGYGVQLIASPELLERKGVSLDAPLEDRVAALQGETIAILNPGDSIDQFVRYLFRQNGLDPDVDVTLQALSNYSNMFAAMRNNQIGVFGGSPPNGNQAEVEGVGEIFISANEVPGLDTYPYLIGAANTRELASNPERVRALVRGIAAAIDIMRERPDDAKACMRQEFAELDQATFDSAWETTLTTLPATPLITEEAFQALETFAEDSGTPLGVTYEEAVAADFVAEALGQ
jgi:ABC-type nitrate/sulfonate/bicarbonate transport system substrate-binding protein